MISESQQDEAALYALGLLDDDERGDFAHAMSTDAELRTLVAELSETAVSLAFAAGPQVMPPAGLEHRLLARVGAEGAAALPTNKPRGTWWATALPWAIAAAAVLAALLTALTVSRQQGELTRARALAADLQAETKQQGLTIQQIDNARERDALGSRKASPLKQVAVCQLESSSDGPEQPLGAVIWDPAHRQGELVVARLKLPPDGRDYQLWVVEEGRKEAVSAGVVHVNGKGNAKIGFTPVDFADGQTAQAFALSLEKAGGSEVNRGPILLVGKL